MLGSIFGEILQTYYKDIQKTKYSLDTRKFKNLQKELKLLQNILKHSKNITKPVGPYRNPVRRPMGVYGKPARAPKVDGGL